MRLLAAIVATSLLLASTFAAPAAKAVPEHLMRFCGFGGDRDLLVGLQAYWRDLEYCRAFDESHVDNMKTLANAARELGIVYSVQSCAPVFPAGYLDEHHAWAIDFLGRKPADLGMVYPVADYCNPATVAAMKHNLDVAFRDVGAASFMIVDYVWPYIGGRWGYSPTDFAAYRAALAGTDGGLRIVDSQGERTLSFWDYFAELSGLRFEPQDVGCASWAEYQPVRSPDLEKSPTDAKRRSFFLFHALYHYCWLRFAQENGEYAQTLGGELRAALNPENVGNGGDLLTWGRLKATGEPFLEEWGAGWIAIAGYHNFPYFTRPYRAAHKRLGLIGETGAAGGHPDNSGFGPARPHYWDPQSNYAITYALGADGQFDDREEDYIYASLPETVDPGGPFYECWRGYVTAMDGFRQYTIDRARRPKCDVLHVSNRSIVHYADNSDYSTGQPYSLSQPLIDLHYDYHQGFFPMDREALDQYRIVLFSPWEYPRPAAAMVRAWLDGAPGRVLVTHSFVPARPCKGLYLTPYPEVDEPAAAKAFGLPALRQTDLRSGQITEVSPEWKETFSLPVGTKIDLPRGLVECEGKPLVKMGDASLVTEVRTPRGGRIVYLNFAPQERYNAADPISALTRACLQAILRQESIAPQAEGSPGWAVARYDTDAGSAFLLINQEATKQARFTEETASMAPTERLSLLLKPGAEYVICDVLDGTIASRRTDAAGRMEVQLGGKNVRLLHVMPGTGTPILAFTDCERRDDSPRTRLPAKLYAHRASVVVLAGLGPKADMLVDGKPTAARLQTPAFARVELAPGEHQVAVATRP